MGLFDAWLHLHVSRATHRRVVNMSSDDTCSSALLQLSHNLRASVGCGSKCLPGQPDRAFLTRPGVGQFRTAHSAVAFDPGGENAPRQD
jgi:hypothetical protein